ncbi:hypothetical protein N8940_00050 [Sphingomonadaceae bacterium]|nr:hypothetical protein [Sphingomonadaceae bacterium]
MSNIFKGMIAGFAATVVLSLMMVAKSMMGVLPDLDVVGMLAKMMNAPLAVGWIAHFMIGTVAWGIAFALFNGLLPGKSLVVKGIIFGIIDWLVMMVVIMPMAGAGFFGLDIGPPAPIMTLVLHVIFGAVLGKVYASLTSA